MTTGKKIFLFLLVLFIGIIIYLIVRFLINLSNKGKSIGFTLSNTLKCSPDKQCPKPNFNPDYPTIKNDLSNWNLDVAKYTAQLVYIVEVASKNKTSPTYPNNFTEHAKLYNKKSDPMYGAILTHTNNEEDSPDAIWIIFRGTQTPSEWKQDLDFNQENNFFDSTKPKSFEQVTLDFGVSDDNKNPNVHKGFVDAYMNFRKLLLDTLTKINPKKETKIIIGGYSLGAAVSTIVGADLKNMGYSSAIYNFASPRVGDQNFCDFINDINLPLFRIVNNSDIVPTMPAPVTPNFTDYKNPYQYVHCGKQFSFTHNWLSVLNNHLMPVYMTGLIEMKI